MPLSPGPILALKMVAVCSSETSVSYLQVDMVLQPR
jgi:hypothetical protein